jgi:uncharacterized membrane protein YgcG
MVLLALPAIRATGLWSVRMPNALNFAFDYHTLCLLVMLAYLPGAPPPPPLIAAPPLRCILRACAVSSHAPPMRALLTRTPIHTRLLRCAGLPQLYTYMLAQRRKVLGGGGAAAGAGGGGGASSSGVGAREKKAA